MENEYCCDEFKESIKDGSIVRTTLPRWLLICFIHERVREEKEIYYCPFCGKDITLLLPSNKKEGIGFNVIFEMYDR